jgi:hypothetical protein
MKHPYDRTCECRRCARERAHRHQQAERSVPQLMTDWLASPEARAARARVLGGLRERPSDVR